MKKGELTCSMAMAKLLAAVPEDAEIGSAAVFVGIKGGYSWGPTWMPTRNR